MFAAKMPPTRLSLATIRPLRYELTGRCLPRYARSHSCRPATFSRPTCLAPSRLFASVPPCSVSKSVANPLSDKDAADARAFRRAGLHRRLPASSKFDLDVVGVAQDDEGPPRCP